VLRRDNVLHVVKPKVDIVVALNFVFHLSTRPALREVSGGAAFPAGCSSSTFSAADAQKPIIERTRHRGFTYLWELKRAIGGEFGQFYIHFQFHDGAVFVRPRTHGDMVDSRDPRTIARRI
jgi:hypothetical protein